MTKATEAERRAEVSARHRVPVEVRSRTGGPSLRQPMMNWAAKDIYPKLQQVDLDVCSIFLMNHYDISRTENTNNQKLVGESEGKNNHVIHWEACSMWHGFVPHAWAQNRKL